MDKFWEAVGGKLADRWAEASVPAIVFWLGGLLAWISSHHGTHQLTAWSDKQTPAQLAVLLIALIGIAASGIVVQMLVPLALRVLEGYWPRWLKPVQQSRLRKVKRQAADDEQQWQSLAHKVIRKNANPTSTELLQYAAVDERKRRRPRDPAHHRPTKIGNILSAAETWPKDKYGLDAATVWPRLWLVLPELTRLELQNSRAALNRAVAAMMWGLLFCLFTPWSILALPTGLAVSCTAFFWATPSRSEVYADLIEAAFDLYRTSLYQLLRWPLPNSPHEELQTGRDLTIYLRRGSDLQQPTFTSTAGP